MRFEIKPGQVCNVQIASGRGTLEPCSRRTVSRSRGVAAPSAGKVNHLESKRARPLGRRPWTSRRSGRGPDGDLGGARHMNIRPASFRDLASIEQLYRDAVDGEAGSPVTEDSPIPQQALLRLWYAVSKSLSSLMPLTESGDALYVAEEGSDVVGFIQAEASPSKAKSWQIVNLCCAATGPGHFARERLLTALCNRGLEMGVSRFHVRVPLDHQLVPVFLEQGFTQFATEQILFTETPQVPNGPADDIMRTARRDDIGSVFQLYLRTTPTHVTSVEGPTRKPWEGAFHGGALARLGKDDTRHLVAERSGVYGWAAIRPARGPRPAILALMCEGHDPEQRDRFIDAVLRELPGGPVSCVLRHYDSELIRGLQQRGFTVYGTQLLLVRDLAIKVKVRATKARKKPVLVPAGIARAVSTQPSLHVLSVVPVHTARERRERSSPR